MTLDEAILKRRSIRSYDIEELEPEIIDGLVDFLSELKVPDDTIDWNFDILPLDDMRNIAQRRSPSPGAPLSGDPPGEHDQKLPAKCRLYRRNGGPAAHGPRNRHLLAEHSGRGAGA